MLLSFFLAILVRTIMFTSKSLASEAERRGSSTEEFSLEEREKNTRQIWQQHVLDKGPSVDR